MFVAGWQSENLYRIFLNILNDDVRDELLKEERPDSLQKYMERAITIDRQLFERKMDQKNRNLHQTRLNHGQPVQIPRPRQPSNDMQLDNVLVARPPQSHANANRLTAEERARRLQNRLCLYCGQAGHVVRNCPSKN